MTTLPKEDNTITMKIRQEPHGVFWMNIAFERKILTFVLYVFGGGGNILALSGLVIGVEEITDIGLLMVAICLIFSFTWGREV